MGDCSLGAWLHDWLGRGGRCRQRTLLFDLASEGVDELLELSRECREFRRAHAGQQGGDVKLVTDFVTRSHQRLNVRARRLRATWLVHRPTVCTPCRCC